MRKLRWLVAVVIIIVGIGAYFAVSKPPDDLKEVRRYITYDHTQLFSARAGYYAHKEYKTYSRRTIKLQGISANALDKFLHKRIDTMPGWKGYTFLQPIAKSPGKKILYFDGFPVPNTDFGAFRASGSEVDGQFSIELVQEITKWEVLRWRITHPGEKIRVYD